jgi:hypothetical protein
MTIFEQIPHTLKLKVRYAEPIYTHFSCQNNAPCFGNLKALKVIPKARFRPSPKKRATSARIITENTWKGCNFASGIDFF